MYVISYKCIVCVYLFCAQTFERTLIWTLIFCSNNQGEVSMDLLASFGCKTSSGCKDHLSPSVLLLTKTKLKLLKSIFCHLK